MFTASSLPLLVIVILYKIWSPRSTKSVSSNCVLSALKACFNTFKSGATISKAKALKKFPKASPSVNSLKSAACL